MKYKLSYFLILFGLTGIFLTACKKNESESSVIEQEIQSAQIEENSSKLTIKDVDGQQEITFQAEGNYRRLDKKGLDNYNRQYQSFKTSHYFYNDKTDISIMVVNIGPVNKEINQYFNDLENNIKKVYPEADFQKNTESNANYDAAFYSYTDQKNNLNNACQIILSKNKSHLYSICAVSQTQPVNVLKNSIRNISINKI